MTCYQISQGGEPVAVVNSRALAERIIGCQLPGFYQVEEFQVEGPISPWRSQKRRHARSSDRVLPGGEKPDRLDAPQRYNGIGASLVTRKASRKSSKG